MKILQEDFFLWWHDENESFKLAKDQRLGQLKIDPKNYAINITSGVGQLCGLCWIE